MPAETDTGQERTIPATARRREQARRRGQVAKSREVNSALMLLGGLAALALLGPRMIDGISSLFGMFYAAPAYHVMGPQQAIGVLLLIMKQFFLIMTPLLIVMVILALLVNLLQVGINFSTEALEPKFERINPIAGFKRLFSKRSLVELVKSLMKIGVVGYVCYYTIRQALPELVVLADMGVGQIFEVLSNVGFRIGIRAGLVLVFIALLDYVYQRFEFEDSIKMTVQEFKQEMREIEGDPMIRARIRAIQREMAQQRMMEEVPEAEVVVTNPTEYAVALKYDPDEADAPIVVAKGRLLIAQKIRDIAEEHGIPIVQDPPLARALYKAVEVGKSIPENLYRAVAEVLAYVYRLEESRKRMSKARA